MRYCTSSRRASSRPCSSASRSNRLTPKPCPPGLVAEHGRRQLAMVAGQHHALGPQQRNPAARLGALAGLVDHGQIEPPGAEQFVVEAGRRRAQTLSAVSRICSTACASSRRASASSERASLRISRRAPGSGLARVVRDGLAEQGQGLLHQLAGQRARRRAARPAGPACARAARAARGPDGPAARPARRLPAAARRDCRPPDCSARRPAPCRRAARPGESAPTTVVVLPVPGGPWISATSRAARAKATAARCVAFRPASSGGSSPARRTRGCRWPSSTSRSCRQPIAAGQQRPAAGRPAAARWRSHRSTDRPASARRPRASSGRLATADARSSSSRRSHDHAAQGDFGVRVRRARAPPGCPRPAASRAGACGCRLASVSKYRPPRPASSSTITRSTSASPARSAVGAATVGGRARAPAGLRPVAPVPAAAAAGEMFVVAFERAVLDRVGRPGVQLAAGERGAVERLGHAVPSHWALRPWPGRRRVRSSRSVCPAGRPLGRRFSAGRLCRPSGQDVRDGPRACIDVVQCEEDGEAFSLRAGHAGRHPRPSWELALWGGKLATRYINIDGQFPPQLYCNRLVSTRSSPPALASSSHDASRRPSPAVCVGAGRFATGGRAEQSVPGTIGRGTGGGPARGDTRAAECGKDHDRSARRIGRPVIARTNGHSFHQRRTVAAACEFRSRRPAANRGRGQGLSGRRLAEQVPGPRRAAAGQRRVRTQLGQLLVATRLPFACRRRS